MENDFIDLESTNFKKKIKKQMVEKEQEYVKQHKPYCFKAAKVYVDNLVADRLRRAQDVAGEFSLEQLKLHKLDLDQFGDLKRFKHLGDVKVEEQVTVGLSKQTVLTGMSQRYIWKDGGYAVDVFVPLDVYNERTGVKE